MIMPTNIFIVPLGPRFVLSTSYKRSGSARKKYNHQHLFGMIPTQ